MSKKLCNCVIRLYQCPPQRPVTINRSPHRLYRTTASVTFSTNNKLHNLAVLY